MRKTKWFAIALLLTAFCGCGSDGPAAPESDAHGVAGYFPLSLSDTWTYTLVAGDSVIPGSKRTLTVVDAGADRAVIETVWERGGVDTTGYYVDMQTAVELGRVGPDTIIATPLIAGSRWSVRCFAREIVATDSVVTTPAGTFRETLVTREFPISPPAGCPLDADGLYETRFYARGVGLVKRDLYGHGMLFHGSIGPAIAYSLVEYAVQ